MAANASIIVVAPDRGFRRSVEFALEAEGFTVGGYPFLAVAEISIAAPTTCCAVIDEDAIEDKLHSWNSLRGLSKPVILLAARPQSLPESTGMCIVEKPVVGNALIEAVKTAMVSGRTQVSSK